MQLAGLFALGLCAAAAASPFQARDELQDLQDRAVAALKNAGHGAERKSCSVFNAAVRKDWAFMSAKERKEYTSAVNCLMKLPPKTDPALAPGVKNRYDDFVAVHINQTRTIHGTGNFLSWHRYFVQAYETALRDECSYQGYQPYWNWFAHTGDLQKSPVFDGSETSMGGDGAFKPLNGSLAGGGMIFIPPGSGGGCITSGPFKNMTVNLGPVSPSQEGETKVSTPLEYNPRCLKRDLSLYAASTWLTVPNLLNVTVGAAARNIATFQTELQGRFADGFLGLHAAGHFVMGGDAGDLYSSPVDPNFYLHHAMVDRVWWLWQALHGDQAETVAGTITINNNPPSRDASLDDPLDMGSFNAPVRPIRDLLNTLSGDPLCYIYL